MVVETKQGVMWDSRGQEGWGVWYGAHILWTFRMDEEL